MNARERKRLVDAIETYLPEEFREPIIAGVDLLRAAQSEGGLAAEVLRLQAKVDALMLEYCPDEMTPAQVEEWGRHQRRVSDEDAAKINDAINNTTLTVVHEAVSNERKP